MRVTTNTFTNDLLNQIGSLSSQQSRLQQQAATGQRVVNPSDDPAASGRILDMQTEGNAVAQYQRNITNQTDVSQASYTIMQSLKKVSDRASEIATLADGLKSPQAIAAYASEVDQLSRQAIQLANAKHNDNYLFGGTHSDQPPFTAVQNPDGSLASVNYTGNTSVASTEIAEGITLSPQTVGANTTGSGPKGLISDSRSGSDLLNHLISLQHHLAAGDTAAVAATDRPQLNKDEDNLIYHLANTGAIQSRLTAAASIAQSRAQYTQQSVSGEMNADLAQTLVKLNQTQTAYQAALQTGGTVLKLSLMDYLR